jgi:hypothetical protein
LLPIRRTAVVFGALMIAAGCTMPQKDQAPTPGSQPAVQTEPAPAAQPAAAAAPAPRQTTPAANAPQILGTTVVEPPTVSNMRPTGTVVGQKIQSLRDDLLKLQSDLKTENDQLQSLRVSARQFAGNYHSLKAAMNARLQVGTTPGNPELVAQWNQAQAELQQVGASIAALNTLASQVSSTASLSAFLLESTSTTFELRGASGGRAGAAAGVETRPGLDRRALPGEEP